MDPGLMKIRIKLNAQVHTRFSRKALTKDCKIAKKG